MSETHPHPRSGAVSAAWAVLRCGGARTLAVVKALADAGFECWTPVELRTHRVPRANVKRRLTRPLLPTYAFADAARVAELIALEHEPLAEHRVLRSTTRVPLIADADLEPLRLAERRRKPLDRGLLPGDRVRLTEGGFAGLSGVVETSRGQFAMVVIPGFRMPLKIARWHLLTDQLQSQPDSGTRRAA